MSAKPNYMRLTWRGCAAVTWWEFSGEKRMMPPLWWNVLSYLAQLIERLLFAGDWLFWDTKRNGTRPALWTYIPIVHKYNMRRLLNKTLTKEQRSFFVAQLGGKGFSLDALPYNLACQLVRWGFMAPKGST